jgi:hypothetical protein
VSDRKRASESNKSPSDATQIDDAAIMRTDGDLESACATPGVIDKKPSTTVHTPNIPETAVSQDAHAIPAGDGAAVVKAGADVQVDRNGLCRSRHKRWRRKA